MHGKEEEEVVMRGRYIIITTEKKGGKDGIITGREREGKGNRKVWISRRKNKYRLYRAREI